MKKRTHNKRPASLGLVLHSIGFALVAIVIGVYYSLVYGQLQDQNASDLQRIDQLAKFLQGAGPIRTLYHQLQDDAETLDTAAKKIRVRLAQPLNGEELTKTLHSIAGTSGLKISQLTMEKAASVGSHRRSDVQLQCTGSYASMCLFLEGISESRWIADITQLTVNAGDEDEDHEMLATLTVYYDHIPPDSNKT